LLKIDEPQSLRFTGTDDWLMYGQVRRLSECREERCLELDT
jgi:hypothetical protein